MSTLRYVNASLDFRQVNTGGDWRLVDGLSRIPPDYPTTPKPIAATISSFAPTYVSVTNSLKRQVRTRGIQAWQIDLAYGAMLRATFAPLWSFVVSRAGQASTFTLSLPGLGAPRGTAAGTPVVASGGQSGTSLATSGWSPSSAILKQGDFIEIDGDRKVYQITADVSSNGSGLATLSLYPALRRIPLAGVTVHTDVVFTVALSSDVLPADFDQCLTTRGFNVSLVEILS